MHSVQLQNLKKSRSQLQQKLLSIQRLSQKLQQINNQMTYKGHQKINSVMMRNIQIKHTSELIIKLSDEYFVEVKTNTALDYLGRRKKNYEQSLKNMSLKIEVMEERTKEQVSQQGRKQVFQNTYAKSTVQAIGKNQQGEQIFNIIEVQDEQQEETKAEKILNNKSPPNQQKKEQKVSQPITTTTTKAKTQNSNKANNASRKSSSGEEQSEEGGDLLLDQGNYSSGDSSLDQIEQEDNEADFREEQKKENLVKAKQQQCVNTQLITPGVKTETKTTVTKINQPVIPVQPKTQIKHQKSVKTNPLQPPKQQPPKKQQKVEPPQEPSKPISRFKLQRMKQKLQQSIQ